MAKLSKTATKLHDQAEEMIDDSCELTFDQRKFIVCNWSPLAVHNVGKTGSFFTPWDIACEMMIETLRDAKTVIDLCAGTGRLSLAHEHMHCDSEVQYTCLEKNDEFIRVGKRVMPQAKWIEDDVLDETVSVYGYKKFDQAISNPPYGRCKRKPDWLRYTGMFEYMVAEIANWIAEYSVFLISQGAAPFSYSGKQTYEETPNREYSKFLEKTGIHLSAGCGIDTTKCGGDKWDGTNIITEIVTPEEINEFV